MRLQKFNLPCEAVDLIAALDVALQGLVYSALFNYIYYGQSPGGGLDGEAQEVFTEVMAMLSRKVKCAHKAQERRDAGVKRAHCRACSRRELDEANARIQELTAENERLKAALATPFDFDKEMEGKNNHIGFVSTPRCHDIDDKDMAAKCDCLFIFPSGNTLLLKTIGHGRLSGCRILVCRQ